MPSCLRSVVTYCTYECSDSPRMLLVTFECIALGFLKSQKCFTKAVYALALFSTQGQLRHREVEWLAQAYSKSKAEPRFLLSCSPRLFLNQGFLSSLLMESRREIFLVSNWKTQHELEENIETGVKMTWFFLFLAILTFMEKTTCLLHLK